jgi:putative heme-binding domain-containing protein
MPKLPTSISLAAILPLLSLGCGQSESVDVTEAGVESAAEETNYVLDADTGITIVEGFDAELLYSVPKEEGSWVAMAFDPQGRLIVSDQDSDGVFRVTLADENDPSSKIDVERLDGFPWDPIPWGKRKVGGALGFLYAFDSLYMSSMKGFYRCRDTDGDDQYDEFTLLKKLHVGYEHSAHSIIKTEDGEGLYLVSGNHSRLPDGVRSLQPEVWGLDSLLPAMNDPSGHAIGVHAPAGWICRISPDGKDWTMISSGMRNSVDIALNREGELFTYDSDLEFDIGSPWYRATRVNHVTSASEFGWRAGSAKWPDYYEDSNGSVIDIGPGSPTAISFGHHSNYPDYYQDKLFLCDWTFGTIYTVDLEESGSSYVGTKKEFLNGTPLNIAAMRFGPDGHMYFVIGGRNTDSKLYRIRYTGDADDRLAKSLVANQELRDLRHSLEQFHGRSVGSEAMDLAWPNLAHDDRNIRYAARIAMESQSLAHWKEAVFAESKPRTVIQGVIGLCRHGDKGLTSRVIKKLNEISFSELDGQDQLSLLRAYSLCLIRLDPPTQAEIDSIIAKLDPHYPATVQASSEVESPRQGQDFAQDLNTELCRVLSYLHAPNVVGKTIALMKVTQTAAMEYNAEMLTRHEYGKAILEAMSNTPNSQNIQYAYSLRRVQKGWSIDDRKYFFTWLRETLAKSGGQSFAGYIRAIREDAIAHLPESDAAAVSWLLGEVSTTDLASLPTPNGPAVNWDVDSAMKLFESELSGRDFDNGKLMYSAGKCIACHRFQGSGGHSGPDLGSVANRYSIRDIMVSILEPSDSISEQYQASVVQKKDGSTVHGRVIYQNDDEIAVASNPFDFAQLTKVPAAEVESIEPSHTSLMPPGMINLINAEELKDLMAYLISGGDKKHKVFGKQ